MSFSNITDIINLVLELTPKFALFDTALKVDQIKIADSININIHINKTESEPKTSTILTTHSLSPNPEEAEPQKSIGLLPRREQSSKQIELEVKDFPFTSGIHLRVNQSSWWNSKRHICIGQLKVIPLLIEQNVSFEGIQKDRREEFQVCLHSDERLTVGNLEGHGENIIIDLANLLNEHSLRVKKCEWTFKNYSHEQVIKFDMLPEIVLSLSKTVAEKAIVMKRKHDTLPVEYYVLVLSSLNSI